MIPLFLSLEFGLVGHDLNHFLIIFLIFLINNFLSWSIFVSLVSSIAYTWYMANLNCTLNID